MGIEGKNIQFAFVAAFAHSWGVGNGKQHIVMLMGFTAGLTKERIIGVIHTFGAQNRRRFPARAAGKDRRDIARQQSY